MASVPNSKGIYGKRTAIEKGKKVTAESSSRKGDTNRTPNQSDQSYFSRMIGIPCGEFSVRIPEDKEEAVVNGILCVSNNIVVVDNGNQVLKLFDLRGKLLSSTELQNVQWGITSVRESTFATCGRGDSVHLWTVRGQTIVKENESYHVDHNSHGIHYNGTYYCVLHHEAHVITILDKQGRQIRQIMMKEVYEKISTIRCDIHMDTDTNDIYIPCEREDGVLCMTIEGKVLWFTPIPSPWGITEVQGVLCIIDFDGCSLHLVSKKGEYVKKLLENSYLELWPYYVCNGQDNKLYVSYIFQSEKGETISVFAINQMAKK